MVATPREESYVWVTWITKLLAGEAQCEWASWFKAHHAYEKLPSDFDSAGWNANHAEMMRDRCTGLEREGYQLYIEDQNQFRLSGNVGVLSGKPDIVAVREDTAKVIDCKTGSAKSSDHIQVLLYMMLLPLAHPVLSTVLAGIQLEGEVHYRKNVVRIPSERLDQKLRHRLRDMMERVCGEIEPRRVPSFSECRFCNIGPDDCPERVDQESSAPPVRHDLF